jgi:hypothetical protein
LGLVVGGLVAHPPIPTRSNRAPPGPHTKPARP